MPNFTAQSNIFERPQLNMEAISWDLSSKELNDMDLVELAEALKTNRTLTTLDLTGNEIDAAVARALAEALEKNYFVTVIGAYSLNKTLDSLLERNYQFKNIYEDLRHSILDLEKSVKSQQITKNSLAAVFQNLEKVFSMDTSSLPGDYPGFSELKEKIDSLIHTLHIWAVNLPRTTQDVDVDQFRLDLLSLYAEILPEQPGYDVAQCELAYLYREQFTLAKECLTATSVITDEESEDCLNHLIHFLIHAENYNANTKHAENYNANTKIENEKIMLDESYNMLIRLLSSEKIEPKWDIHQAPEADHRTRERCRQVIDAEEVETDSFLRKALEELMEAVSFEQVIIEEAQATSSRCWRP